MSKNLQTGRVFINYNPEDIQSAQFLSQKLKTESIEVWIDFEQLLAGDVLAEKIELGLNSCSAALICIGKSGPTEQQLIEVGAACEISFSKPLRVIPVLLPGADQKIIPSMLRGRTFVDFSMGLENKQQLDILLNALNGIEPSLNEVSKTSKEKIVSKKDLNKKAVSVGLFYKDEILVIQRADSQKSGSGLWQLPGGKVNDGETPSEAAIREIDEEAGIPLEQDNLQKVVELVDTWVVGDRADYITMNLYIYRVDNKQTCVANEFKNHKWVKISEIFDDKSQVYLGATGRYLAAIRRFLFLFVPLDQIYKLLSNQENGLLPARLDGSSIETTQTIYEFLSLLGFLSDNELFSASSTLSGNLIKILSEWSLTEASIFEAEGDKQWIDKVEEEWDVDQVARFREGLFDQHKNLLGLLSHKLPKALSKRNICDILIMGHDPERNKKYLLVRWDFLANKFQIPAKGLEDIDPDSSVDIASTEVANYVIKERFDNQLNMMLDFKYLNKIKTSHVGAGSLGDGPNLRNYVIAIFNAYPKNISEEIISILNGINQETVTLIKDKEVLAESLKRALNFYVWADLDVLEGAPKKLIGKKLQGYYEIATEFGEELFHDSLTALSLTTDVKIPIIGPMEIINAEQIDIAFKEY